MAKDSLWRVLIRNIVCILVFELIFQGLSYVIGSNPLLLYSAFLLRIAVLPILLVKMVFRSIDHSVRKSWKIVSFFMCWLPLIVITPIDISVWNHVSGYYKEAMEPWDVAVGETYAMEGFLNLVAWIVTTIVVGISFSNNNRKFKKKLG